MEKWAAAGKETRRVRVKWSESSLASQVIDMGPAMR